MQRLIRALSSVVEITEVFFFFFFQRQVTVIEVGHVHLQIELYCTYV